MFEILTLVVHCLQKTDLCIFVFFKVFWLFNAHFDCVQILCVKYQFLLSFAFHHLTPALESWQCTCILVLGDDGECEFYFSVSGMSHTGICHHLDQIVFDKQTIFICVILEEEICPVWCLLAFNLWHKYVNESVRYLLHVVEFSRKLIVLDNLVNCSPVGGRLMTE